MTTENKQEADGTDVAFVYTHNCDDTDSMEGEDLVFIYCRPRGPPLPCDQKCTVPIDDVASPTAEARPSYTRE